MSKTKHLASLVWMSMLIVQIAGCGNSGTPENTALAGLAGDEASVVIRRENNECTLSIMATNITDGAAIDDSVTLKSPNEDTITFSAKKIASNVNAATIWAVCRDNDGRIVEMGNTTIAIPLAAAVTRLTTKRLPNSDHWYRIRPVASERKTASVSQNDIWSYDANKAVIVGNAGTIQIWNGYGWAKQVTSPLSCIDFSIATGNMTAPKAIIAGRSSLATEAENSPLCDNSNLFSIGLVTNQLDSIKRKFTGSPVALLSESWQELSTVADGSGKATTIYSTRTSTLASSVKVTRLVEDPAGYASETVNYTPSTALLSSYSLSPVVFRRELNEQYYWELITNHSNQYLWRHPVPRNINGSLSTPDFSNIMLPSTEVMEIPKSDVFAKAVKSFSSTIKEGYWISGEQTTELTSPPVTVAIALKQPPNAEPFTLKQATYPTGSAISSLALSCTKIYVSDESTADESVAYFACNQGAGKLWVLNCQYSFSADSDPICYRYQLDTSDSPKDEVLTGIHGSQLSGKSRIWAIGSKGSIWLYQE